MPYQELRFEEEQARPLGRASRGVKGIKIKPKDSLVCSTVIDRNETKLHLLVITNYGYGKNIKIEEFRNQNRGGIGVMCLKFRKTMPGDKVTDAVVTRKDDEIILVTASGVVCRQKIEKISVQKRSSQGVRIMKPDEKDSIIAMSRVIKTEIEE